MDLKHKKPPCFIHAFAAICHVLELDSHIRLQVLQKKDITVLCLPRLW